MLLLLPIVIGCEKYLEKKPSSSLSTITQLRDLRAILDNERVINEAYPDLGDIASDYFFVTESDWNTRGQEYQHNYIWSGEVPPHSNTWRQSYNRIFYVNSVIDNIDRVPLAASQELEQKKIKGEAHFVRGLNFYFLSQLFAPPLDRTNQNDILGIPLRLTSDFNEPTVRSSIIATYNQIIDDLLKAVELLPDVAHVNTRPSKAAAYAVLMRTYLAMGIYEQAEKYADSCLAISHVLIDYNDLDTMQIGQFMPLNDEVIYHIRHLGASGFFTNAVMQISPELYSLYEDNDLRKVIFYKKNDSGSLNFFGDYSGYTNGAIFSGIATDEIYITRAECRVRNSDIQGGLSDLNLLLRNRWKHGTFSPIEETDAEKILGIIIQERFKELAFRGNIRWPDLRRLNKDSRFATALKRNLGDKEYLLPPNHQRYVFKIPFDVVDLTGIAQND